MSVDEKLTVIVGRRVCVCVCVCIYIYIYIYIYRERERERIWTSMMELES